jgi:hypothetical protein
MHCYDVFAPTNFNDDLDFPYINLSRLGNQTIEKYDDYPKFSNSIIEKVKNIKIKYELDSFSIMHFRDLDDIADYFNDNILNNNKTPFAVRDYIFKGYIEFTDDALTHIKKIAKNENKILVFSNNIEIKNTLKKMYNNFILLDEDYKKTVNRDYNDNDYWEYCLIEFILFSFSKKIYLFNNYCWISNFISYGILNNIHHKPVDPYNSENMLLEIFDTYHKNLL